MKQITAFVISFKRKQTKTKAEGWETGLFIGRDDADEKGFIVDMDGKKVETVHNYYTRFSEGSLIVRNS